MVTSWYAKAKEFKSPAYVAAAFLLRSRETQAAISRRLREEMEELNARLDRRAQQGQQQQQEINDLRRQVAELQKERDEARQSVNLPEDRPLGTHGYGDRIGSFDSAEPQAESSLHESGCDDSLDDDDRLAVKES